MHVFAAFAALGLLVVVLLPFMSRRLRVARRGRAVHLNGSCHWYANYDEELRYEPKRRSDIVRLDRRDVLSRGYKVTDERQVVPRTFRRRVPGDTHVRLWRSDRQGMPPLWLCQWAEDPVRVSIGVGERESVPGVESSPLPVGLWDEIVEPAASDAAATLGAWKADGPVDDPVAVADGAAGEAEWAELERLRAEVPGVGSLAELDHPPAADAAGEETGESGTGSAGAPDDEGDLAGVAGGGAGKRKRRRRRK